MRWEWVVFTSVLPLLSPLSLQVMADGAAIPTAAPQAPYTFQYDKRGENDTEVVPDVHKVVSKLDPPKVSTPVEKSTPTPHLNTPEDTHDIHDGGGKSTPDAHKPTSTSVTPAPKVEHETVPTSSTVVPVTHHGFSLDVLGVSSPTLFLDEFTHPTTPPAPTQSTVVPEKHPMDNQPSSAPSDIPSSTPHIIQFNIPTTVIPNVLSAILTTPTPSVHIVPPSQSVTNSDLQNNKPTGGSGFINVHLASTIIPEVTIFSGTPVFKNIINSDLLKDKPTGGDKLNNIPLLTTTIPSISIPSVTPAPDHQTNSDPQKDKPTIVDGLLNLLTTILPTTIHPSLIPSITPVIHLQNKTNPGDELNNILSTILPSSAPKITPVVGQQNNTNSDPQKDKPTGGDGLINLPSSITIPLSLPTLSVTVPLPHSETNSGSQKDKPTSGDGLINLPTSIIIPLSVPTPSVPLLHSETKLVDLTTPPINLPIPTLTSVLHLPNGTDPGGLGGLNSHSITALPSISLNIPISKPTAGDPIIDPTLSTPLIDVKPTPSITLPTIIPVVTSELHLPSGTNSGGVIGLITQSITTPLPISIPISKPTGGGLIIDTTVPPLISIPNSHTIIPSIPLSIPNSHTIIPSIPIPSIPNSHTIIPSIPIPSIPNSHTIIPSIPIPSIPNSHTIIPSIPLPPTPITPITSIPITPISPVPITPVPITPTTPIPITSIPITSIPITSIPIPLITASFSISTPSVLLASALPTDPSLQKDITTTKALSSGFSTPAPTTSSPGQGTTILQDLIAPKPTSSPGSTTESPAQNYTLTSSNIIKTPTEPIGSDVTATSSITLKTSTKPTGSDVTATDYATTTPTRDDKIRTTSTTTDHALTSSKTALPIPPPPIVTSSTTVVDSQAWIPTSLIVAATATSGTGTVSSPTAIETQLPSTLPQIIVDGGTPPQTPVDTTLVRIGFGPGYNYPFVAKHPAVSAQIFKYLPEALAYDLEIPVSNITMHSLQPLDTRYNLGYIKTVAYIFIPSDLVGKLSADLRSPNSRLYTNPDETLYQLAGLIDSSFPLVDTNINGAYTGGDDNSWIDGGDKGDDNGDDNDNSDGGSLLGGTDDQGGSKVMAKSAGIAFGIVGGAAVYGAAMFFVARRYRRRRLRHGRVSSISRSISPGNNPAGALMSGAVMSGAIAEKRGSNGSGGRVSARGQTISGPMQAENSLGWN